MLINIFPVCQNSLVELVKAFVIAIPEKPSQMAKPHYFLCNNETELQQVELNIFLA